jgi:cardiolipin synthase
MAINEARERIYITTPYFVPTPPITAALRAAVYRGIDVRVMVPARNDVMLVRHASRAYYPELLAVGVQIFEYQPTMLHAKTVVFDDALSMIGSANVDNRSFRLNFEASCFIGGARVNAELVTRFERDLKDCVRVQQADLDRLPWHAKLAAATAQLLSPLL